MLKVCSLVFYCHCNDFLNTNYKYKYMSSVTLLKGYTNANTSKVIIQAIFHGSGTDRDLDQESQTWVLGSTVLLTRCILLGNFLSKSLYFLIYKMG